MRFFVYIIIMNTALIVEPRILDNMVSILNHFVNILGNEWNYVFYCGNNSKKYWETTELDKIYEIRELDVINFDNSSKYSDFMKSKELWESLSGIFVLTFQLDTWILNDSKYTIDYFIQLNKSFIGGNMAYNWIPLLREGITFEYYNFNGGLSLRKRLDMIKVIDTFQPKKTIEYPNSHSLETDAEDVYFVIGCYLLGLPLGDDEPSTHFSLHTAITEEFFGIHQPTWQNINVFLNNKYPDLKNKNPYLKL